MFLKAALLNLSSENLEINTLKQSLFWDVVLGRKDGKITSFVLDTDMWRGYPNLLSSNCTFRCNLMYYRKWWLSSTDSNLL